MKKKLRVRTLDFTQCILNMMNNHYTPRMYFSATDINGKPISYEDIKQDIQK